jgi:hypothetical protein
MVDQIQIRWNSEDLAASFFYLPSENGKIRLGDSLGFYPFSLQPSALSSSASLAISV